MKNQPSDFCCLAIHNLLRVVARTMVIFMNAAEIENHRYVVFGEVVVIRSVVKTIGIIRGIKRVIQRQFGVLCVGFFADGMQL